MKALIVCASRAYGNTRRVADRMAEVLHAQVLTPALVKPDQLAGYDLVGFGSGIYYMRPDALLRDLTHRLTPVDHVKAFTFVTSGTPDTTLWSYQRPLRNRLTSKGFDVVGAFACRGWDNIGPLAYIGGINRGRPDGRDLDRAAAFAARLADGLTGAPAAS